MKNKTKFTCVYFNRKEFEGGGLDEMRSIKLTLKFIFIYTAIIQLSPINHTFASRLDNSQLIQESNQNTQSRSVDYLERRINFINSSLVANQQLKEKRAVKKNVPKNQYNQPIEGKLKTNYVYLQDLPQIIGESSTNLDAKSRYINFKHNNLPQFFQVEEEFRQVASPPSPTRRFLDTNKSAQPTGGGTDHSIRQYLPNGPPPFRPSTLIVSLAPIKGLDKVKQTAIFKHTYKSKAYYLFLDVLHQLTLLVDKLSNKKLRLTSAKLDALKTLVNTIVWKSGHSLKLKWPLVLMNPLFLREILSNPTFLVMLFHACEVAYVSSPVKFWLKPFMKLIKQPSPEKEEKEWWMKKRIYETLNGFGSSEFQPNLQTVHFKNPAGKGTVGAKFIFPSLVKLVRVIAKLPEPNPTYYKQPYSSSTASSYYPTIPLTTKTNQNDHLSFASQEQPVHYYDQPTIQTVKSTNYWQQANYDDTLKPTEVDTSNMAQILPSTSLSLQDGEAWLPAGNELDRDQLMSQAEFDSLEQHEKESILLEAKNHLEESKWTNDLIKQQSDFVNSIANQHEEISLPPFYQAQANYKLS